VPKLQIRHCDLICSRHPQREQKSILRGNARFLFV